MNQAEAKERDALVASLARLYQVNLEE
ncbi:MAG: hypothetical protein ACREUQ_06710 [Burkholderiales bacterium]